MKSMAIVSSWEEECGIASYSAYLKPEFEKYYDVEVLKLDTEILRSQNVNRKKMGDELIDNIVEKVKSKDLVNIQFEVGLFGSGRRQVFKRFEKIAKASNNLIVTMHSINLEGCEVNIKRFLNKRPIRSYIQIKRENYWVDFYKELFHLLAELSKKKNVWVIVHNKRDAVAIQQMTDMKNVSDFPLCMLNKEERNKKKTLEGKKNFKDKYKIEENEKTIGLFGFVSDYKGHDVAVSALEYLPDNYKILVFGAQHPANIVPYRKIDPYLEQLLNKINQNDEKLVKAKSKRKVFSQRIVFTGTATDEEFLEAMRYVDVVVLPYMEVKQMGSGVASNALECKANIIMSNTKCFAELKKYYPKCFEQFDIGNSLELANKIEHFDKDYTSNIEKCIVTYNLENNVKNYVKLFEGK